MTEDSDPGQDERLSALDPETRRIFRKVLRENRKAFEDLAKL